ncbi:MAG: WhiB family transcriptional regulator [Egibacteraceae bacterium]
MSRRSTAHLSPSPPPPREWQHHGSCRHADAELFFPPFEVESTGARHAREAAAKAVCAECPVLEQCRDWVLAVDEPHGIWGGLTESERRDLVYARQAS